jgi:hypothetical protein
MQQGMAVLTDDDQLDAHVGQRVVVEGVVSRTKIPQIAGVDVDGAESLGGERARASGVLRRYTTTPSPSVRPELEVARRSPGTYYFLESSTPAEVIP